MNQPYFVEIFEGSITEFKNHLIEPKNERIIFSGKYGIGKTQFLRDFFEMQEQSLELEKYNVIHLFPVNYSIANNKDIQRYIKYDIIIELLKNGESFKEVKSSIIKTFGKFFKKSGHKIAAGIVSMIPVLGKELIDSFDRIDGLKEDFLKYHDEENLSHGDKLVNYIDSIQLYDGSIYENDITTQIITDSIEKDKNRKSLLVIDDLDRLDPEHVFRILNVFASHFDYSNGSSNKNKFGFDKIIIVCDINNIRNIFYHKYGPEVDFNGYIDKFYSTDIFKFDNSKAVNDIIYKVLNSIEIKSKTKEDSTMHRHYYFANMLIDNFLKLAISQQFISLRSILKLYAKKINFHDEQISFDSRNEKIPAWINPIMLQLKLLVNFFGETNHLLTVIEKIKFTEDFLDNHKHRFADLIYTLFYNSHNFRIRNEFVVNYENSSIIVKIIADFRTEQFQNGYLYKLRKGSTDINEKDGEFIITDNIFRKGLIETLSLLKKVEYLR